MVASCYYSNGEKAEAASIRAWFLLSVMVGLAGKNLDEGGLPDLSLGGSC